jgi:hypothetical protein
MEKVTKNQTISVIKDTTTVFHKIWNRFSEFLKKHKIDIRLVLLIIPLLAIFGIVILIKNYQSIGTEAAIHQAALSFQVSSTTLPPQNTFGIWINADSPTAFADVELSFDQTKVKLAQEVSISNTLTRQVKVTTMAEANSTGKVSIVLGLDPANRSNPPSGAFQIAGLTLAGNTTAQNVITAVTFNTSAMQLVAMDQSVFTLTSTPLAITVNPAVATPTPTATPTSTPRPTVTPTGLPTPTLTPTPAGLRGDVNTDGYVNILDINEIIKLIRSGAPASQNPKADLNTDGYINILDINEVIKIIRAQV